MATTPYAAFGQLIRDKRIRQGMTIDGVARLLGTYRSTVIKHEQGRNFPRWLLPLYVEVLQITRPELIKATGLSSYELSEMGCDLTEPTAPEQHDTFYRHQINVKWFMPIDLRQFVH